MQFQPKTEKQIAEESLIPVGIYPFEVSSAESATSKKGNAMIALSLRVFMPSGAERAVKDWLMPSMAFKLFHFCAYTGLSQQYEAGTLTAEDCIGCNGFVKIEIQEDKTGQYPPRNSVRDYMRSGESGGKMPTGGGIRTEPMAQPQSDAQQAGEPEDVPF